MLLYFILIFFTLIIYFVLFKTPFWISNLTLNIGKQRNIYLKYIINKDGVNYVTPNYRFKHSDYDGKLISNILKKKIFKTFNMNTINNYELYKKHNVVNNLLNINEDLYDKNYTKFGNVCANLLRFVSMNNPSTIYVAIVVNNRSDTNFIHGNYISFAFLKINKTMDVKTILQKYYDIINATRNKKLKNFSLYDLYCLSKCDLILDSWRDLSEIKNINSLELKRFEGNILEREYILNFLLSKNKRKVVYFDYFDNNYVINKLEYMNVN
jgi:hypothetical protein